MARLLLVFVLCAAGWSAATDLPPDVLLLGRIRSKMAEILTHLPNYTCLQNTERWIRRGPKSKPLLHDTVRIEVALVHGKELFAWPGTGRFLDTDIRLMVVGGTIGTGSFAGHAKALFQTNSAQFRYAGVVEHEGRPMHKWDYVIAQVVSGYSLRVGEREAVVGYHGAIWADQETLDLRRVEVIADDIPPFLSLLDAKDSIEYERIAIGADSFLLPSLAESNLTDVSGALSTNRTRFQSCRQYTGQSVLIFDDPDPDLKQRSRPMRTLAAPAGVRFDVELAENVVLDKAAVGDPVRLTLRRDARVVGEFVAPKGAVVQARVTYVSRQQFGPYNGYSVGLDVSEMQWEDVRMDVQAAIETISSASMQVASEVGGSWSGRQFPRLERGKIMGSVFFVRSNMPVTLPKGLRMTWRTVTAEPEDKP